ncbi:hypothetical protein NDU88_000516 [Pleurodeles waltl]|uniref:ZP domain-containing protein n=1 Tax=Pleurodeles waltl TaxID=8319 RepID=A0AAV7KQF5_PLEWA|nr:hypothetical protein NDU88_000516 [Pleurodeles waltl]
MNPLLLTGVALLWAVLPSAVMSATFPAGASRMECRPRAFWVWINKDFLGSNQWQIQVVDDSRRPYTVTSVIASQCGFTITRDLDDNVEIRISYFACPVKSSDDSKFNISLQFLVSFPSGVVSYDIVMNCLLPVPWSPREMICEENYVEVSVTRIVPNQFGLEGLLLGEQSSWPVVLTQDWYIDFQFRNGTVLTVSSSTATRMGYGVRTTTTRVMLRSPYNTPQSQVMLVQNLPLEVTISTMSYKQPWVILIVETTTACPVGPPVLTPTSLTWVTPAILQPIVLDLQNYNDEGPTMGIDGNLITVETVQQNGYKLFRNDTAVGITVPIGAPGGKIKSDVQNNLYGTTYAIRLLLERNWRGVRNDITRHIAYKFITSQFQPQPLIFIDYTVPEWQYFNISLGNFAPDVAVSILNIKNQPLTPGEAAGRGFRLTTVPIYNGTNSFFLQVPFLDPLVEQTVLPGYMRQYTLYITYTLVLVSSGKTITFTAVVRAKLQDIVPPSYKGSCSTKRLIMDLTHGSMDQYWVPYIGDLPLTEELSRSQKYIVAGNGSVFHLEVPVPAVGLVYKEVTLERTVARLDFSLKDNQTLETMSSFSVTCNFTTGRMLVCLPNGTMIATILSADVLPELDARRTHLRDPKCLPVEANSSMALFYTSSSTCGTSRLFDGMYLVNENSIVFNRELIPVQKPVISRDTEYKLTIRCRYPISQTKRVYGKKRLIVQRGAKVERKQTPRKVARRAPNLQLMLAKDGSYDTFYSAEDFSQKNLASAVLCLEVDLLQHGEQQTLGLEDCWATQTANSDDAMRWDFISHRCAVAGASHSTSLKDSPVENVKRFAVKAVPSADVNGLRGPVHIHCRVSVCDGSQAGQEACVQSCDPREERTGFVSDRVTEFVSLGPVEILAMEDVVSSKYSGEKQWMTWPWLLSVGLAVIGVLAVASIFLGIRAVNC